MQLNHNSDRSARFRADDGFNAFSNAMRCFFSHIDNSPSDKVTCQRYLIKISDGDTQLQSFEVLNRIIINSEREPNPNH